MKEITTDELLALPMARFIDRLEKWIKEFNNGALLKVKPFECPVAYYVAYNKTKCARELVPTTKDCPICGHPVCPDCYNHNVEQVSRVTGYLSTVSGWGAAKKQEFKDRQRY